MTELIGVATDRRLQLIVSTHSPYVLEQLPAEARIYLQNDRSGRKEVVYGVTPEYALSLMDDERHPELTIYCEDAESEYLVEALINATDPDAYKRVRVVRVGPAGTVRALGQLIADERLPDRAMAVLDADQSPAAGCVVLPGTGSPEQTAFSALSDESWALVAERLAVRPGDLLDAVDDSLRLGDPHTWAGRVAQRLHPGMRTSRVWESVADVWVQAVLDAALREQFVTQLLAALPAAAASGSD